MLNTLLAAFLAVFGLAAGFFIGCGNHGGFVWALPPGLIAGVLLSIPMLRDRQFVAAAVVIVCALIGSVVASQVSDANGLKKALRNQKSLYISVGSYRLGTESHQPPDVDEK